MKLAPGDCELVLQLRRHILPRMSVQIVSDHVRCSAFGNIGKPQLTCRRWCRSSRGVGLKCGLRDA